MKIKGSKSKVEQVTFLGDEHPRGGVVSTFTWQELAEHLGNRNKNKVISFRIEELGLTVYWDNGSMLGKRSKL